MKLFMAGLGLLLIAEGIPWFVGPQHMKLYALYMAAMEDRVLRVIGLSMMLAGLGLLYLFVE